MLYYFHTSTYCFYRFIIIILATVEVVNILYIRMEIFLFVEKEKVLTTKKCKQHF